jgi:hypothetical protein
MKASRRKPPEITDIVIKDWAHLCDQVFRYRKEGHWIFRGVGDLGFELIPKIGRKGARKHVSDGSPRPYSRTNENTMIEHFIRSAPPYIKHAPKSRLEWLAIAQHHGMATRLLDWTESLLVAAYFAIESWDQGRTPGIYAVKDVPLVPKKHPENLDKLPNVSLYYPPHISPNITAQRSVFTVHRKPDQPFKPKGVERLVLKRHGTGTAAITYRLNLDAVGINRASLFPDINGLAETISWRYKWDRLSPAE